MRYRSQKIQVQGDSPDHMNKIPQSTHKHHYSKLLFSLSVVGISGWVHGLSLGASQGKAYIGQPFSSSFQVNLDSPSPAVADNCLSASVFYGDTPINNARLTVRPAAYGQKSRITVSSSKSVNEPIVVVQLRGGCVSQFSRKYTFFSELSGRPSQAVSSQPAPVVSAPSYNLDGTSRASVQRNEPVRPNRVTSPTQSSVFSTPNEYNNRASVSQPKYQAPVNAGSYQPYQSSESQYIGSRAGQVDYAPEAVVLGESLDGSGVSPSYTVPPEVDYTQYLEYKRQQAEGGVVPGAQKATKKTKKKYKKTKPRTSVKKSTKASSTARSATTKSNQKIERALTSVVAPATSPRLTLSSIDWTQDSGEVALRPSMELLSTVNEDKRVQAQQLWRQISAGNGEAILATDAEGTVSADFMTLTKAIDEKEKTIAALKSELAQVKAQSNSTGVSGWAKWLPYLLGALLLGALGWAFSLRKRARAAEHEQDRKTWWRKAEDTEDESEVEQEAQPSTTGELRYQSKVVPMGSGAAASVAADQETESVSAEQEETEIGSDFAKLDDLDARDELERSAKAEELFDVQQQADFFLALGQEEQAIEILQNYISEKPHASALAYLDLFGIYHSLGKEDEFVELREKFNSLFNAEVPEYANYRMDSRGLESYENVIARIQSHWGTPKAVQLIEESVFREPGDVSAEGQAFDPLAYRELLLLYGIAAEIAGTESDLSVLGERRFGDSGFPDGVEKELEAEDDELYNTKIQGLTETPRSIKTPQKDSVLKNVALVGSAAIKDMNTVIDESLEDLEDGLSESSDLDINLDIFADVPEAESDAVQIETVVNDIDTDANTIDFDLEDMQELVDEIDVPLSSDQAIQAEFSDVGVEEIEFDLDLDEVPQAEDAGSSDIDIDFDLK